MTNGSRDGTVIEVADPWTPERLDPILAGIGPPPIPWLVRDLLPSGTLLQWAADPKIGKSFLALDLALAVISGQPFLGLPVARPGPVIYYDEENSLGVIHERVFALARGRGLTALDGRLHLFRFRCVGQDPTVWVRSALAVGESVRPVLTIFDTLLKFSGRPRPEVENDASLMQAVCANLRLVGHVRSGGTALFLHHLSKGQLGTGKSPRGSTILVGDPDGVWRLTRPRGRPVAGSPLPSTLLDPTEGRLLDVTAARQVTPTGNRHSIRLLGGPPEKRK